MAVQSGFCEAQINFNTLVCPAPEGTLQFFIGDMPITTVITLEGGESAIEIQALINAAIIDPARIIIRVDNCDPGLTVTVRRRSNTTVTEFAVGVFDPAEGGTETNSVDFTCNLVRKTKGGVSPSNIPFFECINDWTSVGYSWWQAAKACAKGRSRQGTPVGQQEISGGSAQGLAAGVGNMQRASGGNR